MLSADIAGPNSPRLVRLLLGLPLSPDSHPWVWLLDVGDLSTPNRC